MLRSLRWSRCALAILLAYQASSSTSFAFRGDARQTSAAPTTATPMRVAQLPAPVSKSATLLDGQMSAASYSISDDGGDYGGSYCGDYSNCYDGSCGAHCDSGCTSGYGCCSGDRDSCRGCYTGGDKCDKCGPRCCFYADYLFLQVTDANVTHAQQQNGIGGAGTVPFGEIGTIDTDYDSGIRVGGSICCGPCSSFLMSYSFFETDSEASLDAPIIPGGGGAVGSLVHHPGTALTASVGPVTANYDIQFQQGDALFRHQCMGGSCYTVNFLVGAQVAHLEQDFSQSGDFGGGLGGAVDTTTSINFDGGGLKAGFDMTRQLTGCISMYGRFTASAMQGEFRSRYTMLNTTGALLLADAEWTDNRIVPQLEYEAGFSWCSPKCHWKLSAGYMVSQWLNTVTTPAFIDAVQKDNYEDVGDTITFAGLVARVGCCW